MKSIREPNGNSLLDNSMVLMGGAIGDGNEHDASNLPTLIAGGGGGTIRTGRYIERKEATDLAGIHLALMQRMGVSIDRLGSADTPYRDLT